MATKEMRVLPPELWITIIEPMSFVKDRRNRRALRELCQVSNMFRDIARPRLYHTVEVESISALKLLCRTVTESSDVVAKLIRRAEVKLPFDDGSSTRTMSQFHARLADLGLSGEAAVHSINTFYNRRVIRDEPFDFVTIEPFADTYPGWRDPKETPDCSLINMMPLFHLPSVEYLRFENCLSRVTDRLNGQTLSAVLNQGTCIATEVRLTDCRFDVATFETLILGFRRLTHFRYTVTGWAYSDFDRDGWIEQGVHWNLLEPLLLENHESSLQAVDVDIPDRI